MSLAWSRIATMAFLGFLPLSILWKGGKSLETTWLLVAVAWLCTLAAWARRDRSPEDAALRTPPKLWVPLMLFLLWTFISYLTSSTGNYGLDEVLRDSSLVLLFLWILRESSRNAYGAPLALRCLQVLIVSTVVAAFLGTVVYIFQPVPRFVGSFFDWRFTTDYWPNAWAELVLMVWPVALIWPFGRRLFSYSVIQLFVSGLLLASLFLSYSRAAYVAFGLQVLLWCFIRWRQEGCVRRAMWNRPSLGHALSILCITAGIVLSINALRMQFSPVQSAVEKVTFTAAEGTSSITDRLQFWKQAWELAAERPLFGWGPYSFRFVQTRLQDGVFATSDHAHNVFLKLASERGLPAAVLFGAFLLTILLPTFQVLLRRRSPDIEQPIGQFSIFNFQFSIFLSLVGILTHLLLDFNLQFVGVALPFWLLLALCSIENCPSPQSPALPAGRPVPSPNARLLRFTEISLATILMLLALFEGRFPLLSSIGRHAEARGDIATALTWYERVRGETFSRDLYLSRAHLFLLQEKPQDALRVLDDYSSVNREDARAWKLLGDTQILLKNFPAARTAYEEAYRLGKWNHLGALRGLIDTLRVQKEMSIIAARRTEFDALLIAYLTAIERNTHFISLTPNVEEFLAVTGTFAELFPADAPRYQAMGAKADREAREERQRIAARPLGRLW
ncbi:O-antigen ligase family protein [Candidatus Peregrinibacteria bacterium]|nr:O-antigen ligase family protein [Candidatus Peregrinibacteria bacterium]